MINKKLYNNIINIRSYCPKQYSNNNLYKKIQSTRIAIKHIIQRIDRRLLCVVGPCSINDPQSCINYAYVLGKLSREVKQYIYIIMRVFLEKPRSNVGWKGIIMDPNINNTKDIEAGVEITRNLLEVVLNNDLATGTELLSPILFKHISNLISWTTIGARTSESQIHRQIISGLDLPVGIKNPTDGTIDSSLNGIITTLKKDSFIYLNKYSITTLVKTRGNPTVHLIIRGGKIHPNYLSRNICSYKKVMMLNKQEPVMLIDTCHDNSKKQSEYSTSIVDDIINQMLCGSKEITGIMLESNITASRQELHKNINKLHYGLSITDPSISWKSTEILIKTLCECLNRNKL